jgi:hypothetical protein
VLLIYCSYKIRIIVNLANYNKVRILVNLTNYNKVRILVNLANYNTVRILANLTNYNKVRILVNLANYNTVRILANLIIHNKCPTVIFHSIVDLYYILKWSNSVVSHTEIFHCHVYSSLVADQNCTK